jgi:3-keto-disaccharide hydrolase
MSLAVGCVHRTSSTTTSVISVGAAPSAAMTGGWRTLFDGKTLSGWRGYKSQDLPPGWRVVDGIIVKEKGADDIMTRDQFANFELDLDWKIAKGGNSGVFYRGTEEYDHIYWSGPEYQLLDDANAPDGKNRLTSAAAAYALYAPPAGVVKPFDEWNTTRIIVNGAHVEHWLNGQKVVEYELWSPDWKAKVAASKFAAYPNYGMAKRGYIGIQGDHPGTLSLRNIRIRELP